MIIAELTNLTGQKFNRLTVIQEVRRYKNRRRWLCKCDCGNYTIVNHAHLTCGQTKSCGCLARETAKEIHSIHKESNANSRLHRIWCNMKQRCNNPNNTRFSDYGGRGIRVCEEWNNYLDFKEWSIENGYQDNLTLDRIDVNGNYEPTNCRWVDSYTQQNNMRSNTFIDYNGERHTIAEWSRLKNIRYGTLVARLSRGWSVERALQTK